MRQKIAEHGVAGDVVLLECKPIPGESGAVAQVTLNRPDELNAISWEMLRALGHALDEIDEDDQVRAVLITGSGRAFSAGGDLKNYVTLQKDPVQFPAFVEELHATFGRLRKLRVPAIALVNGVTAAGGLELLLNCDFAIAAESARIGDGHLNFGQMGGGGVLTLLPRIVGLQRATELVFTGRFLDAREAADWGLVSRVVTDEELTATGLELARQFAQKSPLALANAKAVMTRIWADELTVDAGLTVERDWNTEYCLTSEDAAEGLLAFSEKRRPNFTGR
ncbi:MAG: enoyl-CoA hydratase [Actinomycetota bacterium]|jgi:enoyl-CoA hydratase|nr:enoyl-CoA hydratase [Actinomycetota bacterium]